MNISRRIVVFSSAILVTWLTTIAQASPEERAQLFRGEVPKQFMADGWTSVHDSRSQLVLEKPMTGVDAVIVHALTAEANGMRPIWRWTFTFKAISERETSHHARASVTTRDVSGQTRTIPLSTSAANRKYIDAKLLAADAAMPAKYKNSKQ